MPSSWDALFVLVILLPGFMCARIVDGIFIRPTQSEIGRLTEACLYSFLIYTAFAVTLRVDKLSQVKPTHLLALAAYSLALGLLIGGALHHDIPTRLLRLIHLTQKTSNYSVWNDAFRHFGGYVQVQLKDGRSVVGWLEFFSDRDDQKSVFLSDAAWVGAEGDAIPIDGAGVLLTADSGIETILFLRHVEKHEDDKPEQARAHSAE
ncbi:MAG: DUF6338 family protein [Candidatus Acidiferrales bacterium]